MPTAGHRAARAAWAAVTIRPAPGPAPRWPSSAPTCAQSSASRRWGRGGHRAPSRVSQRTRPRPQGPSPSTTMSSRRRSRRSHRTCVRIPSWGPGPAPAPGRTTSTSSAAGGCASSASATARATATPEPGSLAPGPGGRQREPHAQRHGAQQHHGGQELQQSHRGSLHARQSQGRRGAHQRHRHHQRAQAAHEMTAQGGPQPRPGAAQRGVAGEAHARRVVVGGEHEADRALELGVGLGQDALGCPARREAAQQERPAGQIEHEGDPGHRHDREAGRRRGHGHQPAHRRQRGVQGVDGPRVGIGPDRLHPHVAPTLPDPRRQPVGRPPLGVAARRPSAERAQLLDGGEGVHGEGG